MIDRWVYVVDCEDLSTNEAISEGKDGAKIGAFFHVLVLHPT